MDWNRALSRVVAVIYLIAAPFVIFTNPSRDKVWAVAAILFLSALGFAMIKFGGEWEGPSAGLSALGIQEHTPGCAIVLIGWVVFLLPLWISLFAWWVG